MRKLIYWILALMSITLKQLDAYNYEVAIKIICGLIDLIVVLRILSYLMSIDCFEKEYLIIKRPNKPYKYGHSVLPASQ